MTADMQSSSELSLFFFKVLTSIQDYTRSTLLSPPSLSSKPMAIRPCEVIATPQVETWPFIGRWTLGSRVPSLMSYFRIRTGSWSVSLGKAITT